MRESEGRGILNDSTSWNCAALPTHPIPLTWQLSWTSSCPAGAGSEINPESMAMSTSEHHGSHYCSTTAALQQPNFSL